MIDQLYPNFLRQIIVAKNSIIGFILQRAIGKTSKSLYFQNQNILHYNMTTKLHLIQLLRQEIRKLQKFEIVHGDIQPQNFIVNQKDKKDENFTIKLIDFGNIFQFSYEKLVNERITPPVHPPQYKSYSQPYNASGVNSFQLGLCSLMILQNGKKSGYYLNPKNRQASFAELRKKGLTQNQENYFRGLLDKDFDIRNKALFSQPEEFAKELELLKEKNTTLSQPEEFTDDTTSSQPDQSEEFAQDITTTQPQQFAKESEQQKTKETTISEPQQSDKQLKLLKTQDPKN